MAIISDVTEELGGALGWVNLTKEGASIMLFLAIWSVFAGGLWLLSIVFLGGINLGSPIATLGAVLLSLTFFLLALLMFLASNYIVLMRVLGKSIALALKDSDVDKIVETEDEEIA